jgi:hypothetical protein
MKHCLNTVHTEKYRAQSSRETFRIAVYRTLPYCHALLSACPLRPVLTYCLFV